MQLSLKEILRTVVVVFIVVAVFLGAVMVGLAFTPPSLNPPQGNAYAPINTSNTVQNKQGSLGLNNLTARGTVEACKGYIQPGIGGETLRIIRGQVAADGSYSNTSFTASRSFKGTYQINFRSAFAGTPSVIVTATQKTPDVGVSAVNSGFSVTFRNDAAEPVDRPFNFIAIGAANIFGTCSS